MRAKNHRAINRAYLKFSGYLIACVAVGVLIYYCTNQTAKVEVNRIVDKTEEYDKIYVRQIDLANRIDSLFYYTMLFNTNLNDVYLLNAVSRRKQEILSLAEDMNGKDVRLYQKLASEINNFLAVKDSIRLIRVEEDLLKTDLKKCVEDNKQVSRKLTIGGISIQR